MSPFALVGLLVAFAAAVFGRRALFPPRRRLTIFSDRRSDDSSPGPGVRRRTLVFANTGRYAIESARFDDKAPAQNTRDIRYFLLPRPAAEISPDHGPPGTCVTIRGKNFGWEQDVDIQAYDLPVPAPAKAAPKIVYFWVT